MEQLNRKINLKKVVDYLKLKNENIESFINMGLISNIGNIIRLAVSEKYLEYSSSNNYTDTLIKIAQDFDCSYENIMSYHRSSAILIRNVKKIKSKLN